MKRFTCVVLGLCATVVCAQDIVFGGEEAGGRHANQYTSVDAQTAQPHSADGKTTKGDVNTRFFPGVLPAITAVGGGLLGGLAGGLIGGKLEDKFHGGYGYGGGAPFGGYGGYGGLGGYGGYGGYGGGYGGLGGYGGGFGGIKPGRCSGGLFGGFRSATGAEGIEAEGSQDAESESVTFTRKRRSANGDSVVVNAPGENVDARFIGGLFGIPCKSDYTCPGIQKCCFSGFKATCRNPIFY